MNPYHRIVQDGILLHESRLGNKGGKGEVNPVHINSSYKRNIRYLPDGHFKTKVGKVRIYEVLDDQLNNENLIIADIIQAYLTENVSLIQFIVPTEEAEDTVNELAVTIFDRLVQMGIEQKILRQVRTLAISRDMATNRESVANYLRARLQKGELPDSVDLAVVGAFVGRPGERPYGALLLAAYDRSTDVFRTVCKCGSGFTEEDMDLLPKLLEKYRIDHRHPRVDSKTNPDIWFVPGLVLEIMGRKITIDSQIASGAGRNRTREKLTLRLPRFTGKYRDDKSPEDSTTIDEMIDMYRG